MLLGGCQKPKLYIDRKRQYDITLVKQAVNVKPGMSEQFARATLPIHLTPDCVLGGRADEDGSLAQTPASLSIAW